MFPEYEPYGFESDYVRMVNGVATPLFPVEELLKSFPVKGTKVTFLGENGYDAHLKRAFDSGFQVGVAYTVKSCNIGTWSSYLRFEEIDGEHNTVMFA